MDLFPPEIKNIIIEYIFFTPKSNNELKDAVYTWICDKNYALDKYGHISNWNTHFINNMDDLFFFDLNNFLNKPNITKFFKNKSNKYYVIPRNNFNEDLNNWDVSNVVSMKNMFNGCLKFNKPINKWNVSNVENMAYMFYNTTDFNQNINKWDVSNVRNMEYMFSHTHIYNQPLNKWNISNVQTMEGMFGHAYKFNKLLNNWDVSKMNIEHIFYCAKAFDLKNAKWFNYFDKNLPYISYNYLNKSNNNLEADY